MEDIRAARLSGGHPRTRAERQNFRAVATRYEMRAYVFHGTVTVAAIRIWLRPGSAEKNRSVRRSKTSGTAPLYAITVLPDQVV
ncbi:hypothetical protein ABZW44_22005 [Streptomyces mirabilis]